MASSTVDLVLAYNFLKRLTTKWEDTAAYKLGLIDDKGMKLKSPKTSEEKNAYTYMDRLIFNLKRLLGKVPWGQSTFASYAAALWLLKEDKKMEYTDEELDMIVEETLNDITEEEIKLFEGIEEEIANTTGAAVAGTGDTGDAWKHDGRRKEMKSFLRRYMKSKQQREDRKMVKEFKEKYMTLK